MREVENKWRVEGTGGEGKEGNREQRKLEERETDKRRRGGRGCVGIKS